MDGINIVVFLVRCTSGLLLCDTAPTDHMRFEDMKMCRGTATTLIAAKRDTNDPGVWMAKCRYQLATPDGRHDRQAPAAPFSTSSLAGRSPR